MAGLSTPEISEKLIASCREGDREAFRAVYEAHKDRVYSIALYYFHGDTASASDVAQQVFLKLFAEIRNFRGDAAFSTWLYRMVVNTCIDATRRRRPGISTSEAGKLPAALVEKESPETKTVRDEMRRHVMTAIATLPPKLRMAVLLRYFDDLSYEEMAKALACSMGTVASRLSRGHRMLAEKLAAFRGSAGGRE